MRGASVADLELLYRQRFGRFVRVANAVLHDEDRAVDAVQDAFATAVRRRRRFRGDGPLEAWVWRIVVNSARRAIVRRPPDVVPHEWSEPLTAVADVRAAVARLPERQRLALFLRYYADLDYDAIAAVLGISVGTVGATLNAARANVRASLEEVSFL
jgi:RNA polymerase sigma-70 factor, ECF subfamily